MLRLGNSFGGLGIFEFLAAVAASDFAEAFGSGILFGIEGRLNRICYGRSSGIIFTGFDAGAILLGENLRLLQIFVGINVGFFFLLRCLARFFLARGFRSLLGVLLPILRAGRQRKKRSGGGQAHQDAQAEWPVGGPSRVGRAAHQVL